MDNYQKVEQLVNKAGCSYEDAKAALEANDWDMLDAVISLEREGKASRESAEQKTEEPVEITPEVSSEDVTGGSSQKITYRAEESSGGNDNNGGSAKAEGGARAVHRIWNRIRRIMVNNRMIILRKNGQQIINLPIVAPVIALLAFFWATLLLAGLAMLFGCRFHFEGEDLGKTNINSTMDKASDYAEKVRNDFAGKANDRQNTDN